MKKITTTIKKEYLDKILSGEKTIEYKGNTEFWSTRLDKLMLIQDKVIINFICGRKSYKFEVWRIERQEDFNGFIINNKSYNSYFKIYLGNRITGEN